VDRRAVEEFCVPGIVLMENAARAVVGVALEMLEGRSGAPVLVLCGGGNNGGDGLAVARHLHNAGWRVTVGITIDPGQYKGDAGINYRIVQAMGLAVVRAAPEMLAEGWGLVIDAIFGTGLDRPPREPFAALAGAVNGAGVPVLAIDLPSGLDCDSGEVLGTACVRATRTVTFVAEKVGFANAGAGAFTGVVSVGDIGAPREVVEGVGGEVLSAES